MERKQLISDTTTLFGYHKQATALESEYSHEIYRFLLEEGHIVLTAQDKLAIFADARQLLIAELQMQIDMGSIEETRNALGFLTNIKTNRMTPEQAKKIGGMCERIILKRYFNSIDTLPI